MSEARNSYLPVIDLSAVRAGDTDAVRTTAQAIDAVCRKHGFFYVVGHGVDPELIEGMFANSVAFFKQPEDIKQKFHIRNSSYRRGYEAIGHQSLDPGKPSDLLEAYNIGLEFDPGEEGAPRRGPNQWPDETVVPGMAETAARYMQSMESVARQLMRLLAIGLGLPGEYFEASMQRPVPSLRFLHYPPQPAVAEPDQFGCGSHTDWGALTLLAQDNCGGLQVQDAAGAWHDVEPVPGSFIVNLGDLMARWTNDAYRSTVHRVINRVSGKDRYSLPYFFDIDFYSKVSALPGCFSETNPPKYPVVTAGEHHQEKLKQARSGY